MAPSSGKNRRMSVLLLFLLLAPHSEPLSVGDGKPFARIEDAVKAAHTGDEIDVYPKASGYDGTAVLVRTPGLRFVGKLEKIGLDGTGFEYSGSGNMPRAIFQIDPGADGVTIENFELKNAHNRSFNGAGVRINQADRVTVRNCDIHGNDMGIMSNGIDGNPHAGEDQLIDHCAVHGNGNSGNPGYNHNLYLGGTSVTVQFCTIDHSLTGHNLKSRAHFTLVKYCAISSSSNRELDFVEAWDTRRPNSNAVLIGNVIQKATDSSGNRTVIHFGQENGRRDGAIFLINNTIKTPYVSAVLDLSAPTVSARLVNNVIENTDQAKPILAGIENGASLSKLSGGYNVISPAYSIEGTLIDPQTLFTDPRRNQSAGRGRKPLPFPPGRASYTDGSGNRVPAELKYFHSPTAGWQKVSAPQIGAGD